MEKALEDLDAVAQTAHELRLSTAYPLGGIPMGKTAADSVVGLDFRVHGMGNLYVCDGSVYVCDGTVLSLSPASDPQVTIMALARLGAEAIAHHGSPKPLRLTLLGPGRRLPSPHRKFVRKEEFGSTIAVGQAPDGPQIGNDLHVGRHVSSRGVQ